MIMHILEKYALNTLPARDAPFHVIAERHLDEIDAAFESESTLCLVMSDEPLAAYYPQHALPPYRGGANRRVG